MNFIDVNFAMIFLIGVYRGHLWREPYRVYLKGIS